MQKKAIIHTDHSLKRKFERDISDDEIKKTLDEPDYVLSSTEGRKLAVRKIDQKTVHVVYKEEKANIIVIITVY